MAGPTATNYAWLRAFSASSAYTPFCAAQFRYANGDLYLQKVGRMPHGLCVCGNRAFAEYTARR
jgi:hypothetical protein